MLCVCSSSMTSSQRRDNENDANPATKRRSQPQGMSPNASRQRQSQGISTNASRRRQSLSLGELRIAMKEEQTKKENVLQSSIPDAAGMPKCVYPDKF